QHLRFQLLGHLLDPAQRLVGAASCLLAGWLLFDLSVPYTYWLGFSYHRNPPMLAADYPQTRLAVALLQVRRLAFTRPWPPPDRAFWLARGRLLRSITDLPGAREALMKCLALDGDDTEAFCELALVERGLGRRPEALALLQAGGARSADGNRQPL